TAHGRTAKSNASTAHSPPSGPTPKCSPPTPNAPPHCQASSTTTTTGDATAASEASHPSADCHQPDGRVQLEAGPDVTSATTPAAVRSPSCFRAWAEAEWSWPNLVA